MTERRSWAVTLLPLLSNAAAMHTALMLFAFRDAPTADHLGMLIWWAGLMVCHGVLSLFLRKPRELRSIVLLCGGVSAVQLAMTIWLNPIYPTLVWWGAVLGMWAAGYYQCATALVSGVKPEALMVNFETTALTLMGAAAISGSGAIDGGVLVHLVMGVLCILAALMALRTLHTRVDAEDTRPMAGLLMPLILLGTAGCAALFCVLISGYAERVLTAFTAWLGRVLKAAAQAVGDFIFWLFSLLPEPKDGIGGEMFEADALPSGPVEGVPEQSGVLLYVLIGAVVIALAVLVMKMWRTVRTEGRGKTRRVVRTVTVRKPSLADALGRFFRRIFRRVRFEWRYFRSRNTAAGLLVWLERMMRRKGMRRGPGETPTAFLRRTGETYPQAAEALDCLARCLERYYFGGGEDLTHEEARELRRAIGKGMRE